MPSRSVSVFLSVLALCQTCFASPVALAQSGADARLAQAMEYVRQQKLMYPAFDSSQANHVVTRIDLVASIVRSIYKDDLSEHCFDTLASRFPAEYTLLFSDFSRTQPLAQEACVGMLAGIAQGRRHGRFDADAPVTLAEAAKIITKAYGIAPVPPLNPQPNIPWHEPYRFALAREGALPSDVRGVDQPLNRGHVAQILYALRESKPERGFYYDDRTGQVWPIRVMERALEQEKKVTFGTKTMVALRRASVKITMDKNKQAVVLVSPEDLDLKVWVEPPRNFELRFETSLRDPNFVRRFRQEIEQISGG